MQHFAALGGEVVDVLLHLALVLAAVAHLTLDQLAAVLAADDGGNPVAEPSSQNLDCVGGVLGAVRDRVRAFDGCQRLPPYAPQASDRAVIVPP